MSGRTRTISAGSGAVGSPRGRGWPADASSPGAIWLSSKHRQTLRVLPRQLRRQRQLGGRFGFQHAGAVHIEIAGDAGAPALLHQGEQMALVVQQAGQHLMAPLRAAQFDIGAHGLGGHRHPGRAQVGFGGAGARARRVRGGGDAAEQVEFPAGVETGLVIADGPFFLRQRQFALPGFGAGQLVRAVRTRQPVLALGGAVQADLRQGLGRAGTRQGARRLEPLRRLGQRQVARQRAFGQRIQPASSKAVHQRGGASVRAATSPRLYQSAGKACLGSGLGPIDTQPGSANVAASSPSHRRLPSSSMFPRTCIACHHPSPFDDSLR